MQPPGAGKRNPFSLQFVSLRGDGAKQMLSLPCLEATEANASLTLQSAAITISYERGRDSSRQQEGEGSSVHAHAFIYLSHSLHLALFTGLNLASRLWAFGQRGIFPPGNLKPGSMSGKNHSRFTHVGVDNNDRRHETRALCISSVLWICCAICHSAAHR